jgi:hypothetical protein
MAPYQDKTVYVITYVELYPEIKQKHLVNSNTEKTIEELKLVA